MQRRLARQLAVIALLVGLAGCSSAGSLSMTPAPNATVIADHASLEAEALDADERQLVAAARNGAEPTVTDDHPPFTPDRPIAVDGAYYNVSWSTIAAGEVPEFALTLEKNPSNTTGESIAYEALPAVDRRALPAPDSRLLTDDETIATLAVYTENEQDASVLVPDPEYDLLEIDGRTIRVTVEGPSPKTIYTYRYDASPVAETSDELASQLESEHLFTLSNLTASERRIVENAIGDTHYVEDESDAWTRLLERFDAAEPVYAVDPDDPEYVDGEYLVRYDGTVYWADISGYLD